MPIIIKKAFKGVYILLYSLIITSFFIYGLDKIEYLSKNDNAAIVILYGLVTSVTLSVVKKKQFSSKDAIIFQIGTIITTFIYLYIYC